MAVELQRLMEKVSHMDVNLIAGKGGIHNLVTWVHMVETTEASDFLEGGEVAFTTGLGLGNRTNLLDLIRLMYEKKVAGVIVNTGPFIEEVPEDAITFCNEHDFPLFVIPWKIHLAEVMRIFCFAITKDEQRILETAAGFKNAIFFPKQEELYVVPLSQQGFRVNWKYAVCMMNLSHTATDLPVRLEQLVNSLDTYARHKYDNFAIFSHDSEILIVAGNYSEHELHTFIQDLRSRASQLLASGESVSMGCGKVTDRQNPFKNCRKTGKLTTLLSFILTWEFTNCSWESRTVKLFRNIMIRVYVRFSTTMKKTIRILQSYCGLISTTTEA